MDFATKGHRCVSLIPAINAIIDGVEQNVQALITEGKVYRPFQTETYLMKWEREGHPYPTIVDSHRREERERMYVGYSEPLKAASRAESKVKDQARQRSSIGIQSTAIPYLVDEINGESVPVPALGVDRGLFILQIL